MLTKLAFKNVGKSIKDFTIYFFTLAFGVCVFYMFNSIYAQQAMLNMTQSKLDSLKAVCTVISYISGFVAVVLGFLIVYANGFFIKRRKKELGIYMTLGMNKRKISLILVLETSVVAILSLIVGLVAGIFLSQFMSVFTAKIFEADMTSFQFVFSFDATIKTVIYFGIVFLVVIIFNAVSVSRFKLIDLIYGGRKNQTLIIRNTKLSAFLCILSVVVLASAYYCIVKSEFMPTNVLFLPSIALGIFGTVLFFFSVSGLLVTVLEKNSKIYYKNLNMFTIRQLGSKINTNFISVSVVSIVLLLTIGIFATGYSIQSAYSDDIKYMAPFEYTYESLCLNGIKIDDEFAKENQNMEQALKNLKNTVKKSKYVKDYIVVREYMQNSDNVKFETNDKNGMPIYYNMVSLSDYNRVMKFNGKDELKLDDKSYAISSNYEAGNYFNDIIKNKNKLICSGKTLLPKTVVRDSIMNGVNALLIVPDNVIADSKNCYGYSEIINVNLKNSDDEKNFENEINTAVNDLDFNFNSNSRTELYTGSIATKALFSFIAIYLGIVFMITCAAILAIQQLTEAADNKSRYELLSKLGADKKMLNKALFVQILCYFIFPLILAISDSIFGLIGINKALMFVGGMNIGGTITVTALFVGGLYLIYFLLTYFSSKAIINKK